MFEVALLIVVLALMAGLIGLAVLLYCLLKSHTWPGDERDDPEPRKDHWKRRYTSRKDRDDG